VRGDGGNSFLAGKGLMPPTNVHEELVCAGFGGQGIMFFGKLLAQAAMVQGLNVTYLPSYGAEVRGGTAHCNVIISSDEIASPVVGRPTSVIVMNHPSLLKFEERVRPGGLLIVNTSLALSSASREDVVIIEVPATEMADSLGTVQVANMVALGCYLKRKPVVAFSIVLESLTEVLPKRRHDLLRLNQAALRKGAEFVAQQEKAAPARSPVGPRPGAAKERG
jgi:2-oxoglutarate ferredoxin oxidoreductase subunit gamma